MYGTLDLFSGAGGLSLGFSQENYDIIAGVDVWEDAVETFRHNHSAVGLEYNIAEEKPGDLPLSKNQVDVVIGGPPCKGFSLAGERDPDDDRNQLVSRFIDYVEYFEPEVAVMENVVGILSMKDGNVIDYVYERYDDIGYNIDHKKLKSEEFNIPQRRHRVFFIASRNHQPSFPTPDNNKKPVKDVLENIDTNHPDHQVTNHSDDMVDRISEVDYGNSLYDNYSEAWKRIHPDRPAPTIKENHGAPFIHPKKDRVGTPRECARIQTFPRSFEFQGSKSSKLKQIGNAVPPNLANEVAKEVDKILDN
jgi:DNA (cytosine-5)-methyltransferase 1